MKTELLRLSKAITDKLKSSPPETDGMLSFGFWLAKYFYQDLDVLELAEKKYGELRCNRWLCGVMIRSGVYTRTDEEYISATLQRSHS